MAFDPLVSRLLDLDTCSVSDALDRAGIDAVIDGLKMMWPCGRVGGRVITVRLVPAVANNPSPSSHLGTKALGQSGPGDVIVVDNGGRRRVAGWGGLLSSAAIVRGVAAVVIYGACRDVDETRALGLPLFATNACPRTARGRVVEASTGEPIDLGGVMVCQRDLILADGTGVVIIPEAVAPTVLDQAEEIAANESHMAADLHRGDSAVSVMGGNYEHLVDRDRSGEGPKL